MTKATTVLKEKGSFGTCSCGGEVLFYSNHGVQCKKCGKLYAVWHFKRQKRSLNEMLNENVKPRLYNKQHTYAHENHAAIGRHLTVLGRSLST